MENSVQEEFLAVISHELRTPLTSIRGFSQTLLGSWDKISEQDKKKFIGVIEAQSNRLINLVENILSVSKLNSDKQVLKKVDVNNAVSETIPLVKYRYKDREFEADLFKNLPAARLDEDKFQQVMTNLLDNAAKYSEYPKKISIKTGIFEGKIYVRVKDEGVGIKKEDYGKIFQKFVRLENHLTGKTQGNGLGLFITKELVEKMGGEISFQSEENKGTVFEVRFPIYNPEDALKCSQMS